MTPRFKAFVPFIIGHEVAYQKGHYGDEKHVLTEHDPDDPGGTTRYGIDYGEHKEKPWNMTQQQIDRLTLQDAQELYFRHWTRNGCEQMPEKLGEAFMNCATMSGKGQAKLILARQPDVKGYLLDAIAVFDKIVARRPTSAKYLSGWKARIYDLANFLKVAII